MGRYADWITQQCVGDMYGKCAEVTQAMVAAFPELRRVRGHVHSAIHTTLTNPQGYPHWWCVTSAGVIVDPTASQFPCPVMYEAWDESLNEPTGKCPNCGDYTYDGSSVCSDRCGDAYVAYCSGGLR